MKNLVNLKVDREGTITGSGPPEEAALFAAAVSVGLKAAQDAETNSAASEPLADWEKALRDAPKKPKSKDTWHHPKRPTKPGFPQTIVVAPTKQRAVEYTQNNRGYAPTLVRVTGVEQAPDTLQGFQGRVICVDPVDWHKDYEVGARANRALDPLKADPDSEVLFAHTHGVAARTKG